MRTSGQTRGCVNKSGSAKSVQSPNLVHVALITSEEIHGTLRRMKIGKLLEPIVSIEAWKAMCIHDVGILTDLFNQILVTGMISNQSRLSIITTVFKGRDKGFQGIKVIIPHYEARSIR